MTEPIDVSALIPLCESGEFFPGGDPHLATLRRYAKQGFRGEKLQTIYSRGQFWTSEEWIQDFLKATNSTAAGA